MPILWRILVLAVLVAGAAPAACAKRVALVVGNNAYVHVEPLTNARNDADAMAKALQTAGFAVTRANDVSRDAFFGAIDAFVLQMGKDDEVVFYYAGHGVQIDASPYLLPVDIRADSARQLTRDALPLDTLLTDLSRARYALAIVDACRNNPFAATGKRAIGGERGLAPVEPPEGIAVILSAGRGQTALDTLGPNDREPNGVFIREFIRQMAVPGVPVRDMLPRIRDAVEQRAAQVAHKQRPALIDESRGEFFFFPAATTVTVQPRGSDATHVEIAYWNSVQERGGIDELRMYVKRHPQGQFVDLAQARIERLQAPALAGAASAGAGDAQARRQLELAQKGSARAMSQLGNFYRDGRHGLDRDFAQALQWYTRGSDAGSLDALSGLGTLYERGLGVTRDPARAVAIYQRAADGADSRGMNNLGAAYASGIGGLAKDDAKALEWYRRAAAVGNGYAMSNIGAFYANGRAVPRDDAEAVRWFQRAVDGNTPPGFWRLADMYLFGRGGLTRDPRKAEELYARAIDAGEVAGMNGLAALHLNGWGVPKDDAVAAEWFRKSMAAGDPRGIAGMGYLYQNGRGGVAKDLARARELYERAVALDDSMALSNFAFFYLNGLAGVDKDMRKAVELWTRAADHGYARAMFHLGSLYQRGTEVPKDLQLARTWFERAASYGDESARKALLALK